MPRPASLLPLALAVLATQAGLAEPSAPPTDTGAAEESGEGRASAQPQESGEGRAPAPPETRASASIPDETAPPTLRVTNLAGHALSGTLVRVSDQSLFLRLDSGAVREIPFRVLAPGERERVRALAGAPADIPREHTLAQRELDLALARIDARESAGEIDAAKAAALRSEARAWASLQKQKATREKAR